MRLAPIIAALTLVLLVSSARAQYGVEFTAPDTTKTIYPDTTGSTDIHFPVHIKNIGTASDHFVVDFPSQNFPPDWFSSFCDTSLCFALPCTLALNPGDTVTNHIHVAIAVFGETGTGWVLCHVTSVGNPSLHPELRFWLHAFPNGVEEVGHGVKVPGSQGVKVNPNPMREGCEILWGEGQGRNASLKVYDIRGRSLVTLHSASGLFRWDGKDALSRTLPAGMYFYVAEAGSRLISGKILRIR